MTSSTDDCCEPDARRRFHALLGTRLDELFQAQSAGFDCPPASLYRLEGMLEAGIATGWLNAEQLPARLAQRAPGKLDWLQLRVDTVSGQVSLRPVSPRAPVYPTGGS